MSRGKPAHFSLGTNAERLPGDHALARRPLERSANFGDCLVAIFVQFLELLLQRPKFSGTFGRPFPINIEFVGRRWTGRRSLHEAPAPLASMCRDRWWKTYLHASQIGIRPIRPAEFSVWSRAGVASLHPAVCCLDARPGSIWWQKMDAAARAPDTSYSYGPPSPRLRCNRQPNFAGTFLCCSVIVRYALTAFRNRSAAALRNLRDRHVRIGKLPESDCARSSTSTSATPATRSRRSSRSGRKKRPQPGRHAAVRTRVEKIADSSPRRQRT